MTLRPSVEPMLAQAAEALPGPAAPRAGVAYEQKLEGHRALLFTAAWSSTANWSSGTPKTDTCRSRRCSAGPPPAPAYFIAFDLLHCDGQELLARPYDPLRGRHVPICDDRSG
ncbi:hypothetical protein ACWGHA_40340 [Streptomyces xanthophaeus]